MHLCRYLLVLAALCARAACANTTTEPVSQPIDATTEAVAAAPSDAPYAWSLIGMPMVMHWEQSPDHRHAFALALERRDRRDSSLIGFSVFRNSFGQPSAYAYVGKRWDNFWDNPNLTLKLTGGLLYGYVGQWQDRVPFNHKGFSPCIVPVLLYHLDADRTVDLMVLGVGGVGFSFSHEF